MRPMRFESGNPVRVRLMGMDDRSMVNELIQSVENFSAVERECAQELVNLYLDDADQKDYAVAIALDSTDSVAAYACWGAVPLTRGTYDLYWIATHPGRRGRGFGRAVMEYVQQDVKRGGGRLLVAETSAKASYRKTIEFYQSLEFEEASHIRDFYDVGDDRLIFVKRLS